MTSTAFYFQRIQHLITLLLSPVKLLQVREHPRLPGAGEEVVQPEEMTLG